MSPNNSPPQHPDNPSSAIGSEPKEHDLERLQSEVTEVVQKIHHCRTTLPDQLRQTPHSVLAAQRPILPISDPASTDPATSANPNPDKSWVRPWPQPPPSLTNKRPLDTNALQNCRLFKIRAVLKDLRPHFIEVLRAPEFRSCKAAHEIQEQMKLLMVLYKQLTAEDGQKTQELSQPAELASKSSGNTSEKQRLAVDSPIEGSYIVGGSAFGWNFITYSGDSPVYYGITKESFRTAQVKLWE